MWVKQGLFWWRKRSDSPGTCAAGVTFQCVDDLVLVLRFWCAAAAETESPDAFVSKP